MEVSVFNVATLEFYLASSGMIILDRFIVAMVQVMVSLLPNRNPFVGCGKFLGFDDLPDQANGVVTMAHVGMFCPGVLWGDGGRTFVTDGWC